MGEDWVRKTEKSYRRSIQKAIEDLIIPKPLLVAEEMKSTAYPCSVTSDHIPRPGTRLILHEVRDGNLEVLQENHIVGNPGGEAKQDLVDMFHRNPNLCGFVEVEVTEADPATRYLEFSIMPKAMTIEER